MPLDDREQQFERALARLLRDASPESHCPDAEILSAYHERSLPESQLAYWKEHIALCARCQEILALVEQSEDVYADERPKEQEEPVQIYDQLAAPAILRAAAPQAAARAPVRVAAPVYAAAPQKIALRPGRRWLVPVGALAACAIVAVGIREIQTQRDKEAAAKVQMARNETLNATRTYSGKAPASAAPEAPAERKDQAANKETPEQQALDKVLRDQTAKDVQSGGPRSNHESMPMKRPPPVSNAPALSQNADELASAARMAAPPAVPEASSRQEADNARRAATAALAPQPPVPAPTTEALAKKTAPEQKQEAGGTSPMQNTEVQGEVSHVDAAAVPLNAPKPGVKNLLAAAASDRRYIVAPHAKTVWRVGDGGKIERSGDMGRTWKPQTSGVTQDLTTGSATSDNVCWVVGKSGTILVSSDGGRNWKQVPSPIAGDIGGIHAADELHASIWDVPNHVSFETRDGGANWTGIANE